MASCLIEAPGDSPSLNVKEQKNRDDKLITPEVGETESYNARPSAPNLSVTFEEYTFYAQLTRAEERRAASKMPEALPIWALSQLGYVPRSTLYVLFGALAGYTGHQIWTLFFHLDSHRHPIQSYGDLAYRIYGGWARHVANVLQSFQLFFSVGLLTLAQGQGISQLSTGSVCFAVCNLIFTIAGCIVGQIRTLQKFKWLATLSIWLNIAIMAITMAGAASYPPNYSTALAQNQVKAGPIVTSVGTPADGTLSTRIVGLMQGIYSYGGAMLYCEFMAEMKRPWDFWKAFFCAQTLIVSLYVFYGLFVYSYQGQFAVLVSNQGISLKVLQTATNAMSVASSLILACLYGNVGIKVLYMNIGEELLGLPNLHTTTRGKQLFAVLVPVYWTLAFVICSAIPNITNFSALIASACVTQFTYTFPPILMLGFAAQKDAYLPGESFDPTTGRTVRHDNGMKRWVRGLKQHIIMNLFNTFILIGAVFLCGLGIVASIILLVETFESNPKITSFTCFDQAILFVRPTMSWSPESLPDLMGRVYLVTGGNAGIGFQTVLGLARQNAKVYIGAGSEEKGAIAIEAVRAEKGDAKVELVEMDMMDLKTVVRAAEEIIRREKLLHGLVNNAGIMATPYEESSDAGYEAQFQTNYLSHWLLTSHLLPLLIETSRPSPVGTVRIVNVSSDGHLIFGEPSGIDFNDINQTRTGKGGPWSRCGSSKLANILHAKELDRQYGGSERGCIWTASLHPGTVDTKLSAGATGSSFSQTIWPILKFFGAYSKVDTAAYTSIYAVASDEFTQNLSGEYLQPVTKLGKASKQANDPKLAKDLWSWTLAEMSALGFAPVGLQEQIGERKD
ncbi:uncharacterized protein Z519_00758 [Cladophialophora bantiana CBS 173.52]|uniref:Amino acid transporter transmembrane domain-containing protein n=1 Tax=Cladophialophora bantiana (strain ATCC 10958 / CBS 173.52 / CDC B-1940 / NIH 8579) TaxID=1442370 RepID=A0A0D2I758_CLAB1|nr:uncharacterized protein Z519_00758 [Cladophialophora bantiana CBS 173.52]KIW99095.1 hypothetical protein Z519_00758 [Cladophialophora bantiana CBS 173.52]